MRGMTARQRLCFIAFALILSAALFPGSTEASRGAVVAPIPTPSRSMSLVVNSAPHALPAIALPRHAFTRYARISYRRIVRPHIITVSARPATARSSPTTKLGKRSLIYTERFPRPEAPRGSILIVRGDSVGFVLFP
jgi:hypothetical protein